MPGKIRCGRFIWRGKKKKKATKSNPQLHFLNEQLPVDLDLSLITISAIPASENSN